MNVEEFREYCLSLPGVSEKMPFPNVADRYSRDVLCFYVGDKWFCFVNIEVFDFCCIKCRPDESTELRARYEGVKPGWHMNKKYWNSVYFNQDVPDSIIRELNQIGYCGPLSVEWEDSGMERIFGATEAFEYASQINFEPSTFSFDSALKRD